MRPTRHAPAAPLRALCALGAAALLLLAGPPARSEVAGPELQRVEIIGTSPLGADGAPLARTPANVQTLRARDIREQGASNLADLLNDNLGPVSVSNGTGSPYQNDVNYRGFQATSVLGAPVGLSVYLDGVRMNEPFGALVNWDLIPMNAIARVSLIPGSNPVFGLNTLGGSVALGTKNGRDFPQASIDLSLGSFQRRALAFEAGGLGDAQTDYFVAGNIDRQDGWRQHSASEVQQLFGKLRWRGNGDASELQLSLALANTHLQGTQALPRDMLGDRQSAYTWPDRTANRLGLLSLSGKHALSANQQFAGQVYLRDTQTRAVNSNAVLDDGCYAADGSLATTAAGAYKCGDKAPGGTAVNSITGANALALGFGRWTSSINTSLVESSTRQRSGGLSLQWLNTERLLDSANAFTLGVSLDSARVNYSQATLLARLIDHEAAVTPNLAYGFTADRLAPSASNPPSFQGSPVLSQVDLSATTRNFSLYFNHRHALTERWSLNAAGSFNRTEVRQNGLNAQFLNDDGGYAWTDGVSGVSYYNPGYVSAFRFSNTGSGAVTTPNGVPQGAVAGPETNTLDGTHRWQRFNPALGASHQLDRHLSLFGGYSEALRAPTVIELSCADPSHPCALPTGFNGDPELKPVVARTVELGARGELADRVSWNLAVYDTRLQDDIQFIATSSAFGYFANVGDTRRRGAEVGVQAEVDGLRLSASAAHVQAVYRTAFTTAAGEDVPAGSRIPGIASTTLKLRTAWQATPQWLLGANVVAVGRQYAHGNENNRDPDGVVPGHALAHLDLHYRPSDRWTLSAQVSNLFDRRYSTYGLSNVTSIYSLATQSFFTPAPPRAVRLSLNVQLGP